MMVEVCHLSHSHRWTFISLSLLIEPFCRLSLCELQDILHLRLVTGVQLTTACHLFSVPDPRTDHWEVQDAHHRYFCLIPFHRYGRCVLLLGGCLGKIVLLKLTLIISCLPPGMHVSCSPALIRLILHFKIKQTAVQPTAA